MLAGLQLLNHARIFTANFLNVGFKTLSVPTQEIVNNRCSLFNVSVRNIMRCHFPRPSERKRVKRHGFMKRMSTPAGQRIIMNRILKGRHVLTH